LRHFKRIALFCFVLLLVLLAACSSKDSKAKEEKKEAAVKEIEELKSDTLKASNPAAAPEISQKRGNTVVVGLVEPGGVFTPYFNESGYDGNVQSAIFSSLVEVNEDGEPIPGLAEKWEISEDELTYTFQLRDGLLFDDGSPLTAKDVEFTLTLLHDPGFPGTFDITKAQIAGGLDYKKGKADHVSGINVIDDKTIEIKTEKVNARTLSLISGYVLKKDYYGKGYKKGSVDHLKGLHQKPVGNGPFRYVKYLPGQEVRYEANEHYHGGKPQVDQFIYKIIEGDSQALFETGELDFSSFKATSENLDFLKSLEFANVTTTTYSNYSYIAFNHRKEIFKDSNVRKAFILGLDREAFVKASNQEYGRVANVPVGPNSWAYTDKIGKPEYNPEKAKQLLEEAGWKAGKDGIREKDGKKLKVYYYTSTGGSGDTLVPIAKENYKEIGIDLQVEQMDFNALLARVDKGDHDLVSFGTTLLSDPYSGISGFHSKETAEKDSTFHGYGSKELDQLIDDTVATTDQAERTKAFHKLYEALEEDPPQILLNYSTVLSASNARVEGLIPNGYTGISSSLKNLKVVEVKK